MAIRGSKSAGEPMVNITVDRDMVYAPDGNRQTRRILHGPKFDKKTGKVLEPGDTIKVPLRFAQWAIGREKAHAATDADAKIATKVGPITEEDFVGKKATR